MSLVGIWSAPDYFDCQLNIFEDGAVNISLSGFEEDIGEFDCPLPGQDYTLTDSGLSFRRESPGKEVGCSLTLRENGGELASVDGTVVFVRVSDKPYRGTYRFINFAAPVRIAGPLERDTLVGKWKSPVPYDCTMDIFPEGGDSVRVWISFGRSPSFEAFRAYQEDDALVWMINDSANRGRCILRMTDGILLGTYTQLQKGDYPPVRFTKVSEIPEKVMAQIALPDIPRLALLRQWAAYEAGGEPVKYEYVLGEPLPDEPALSGFREAVAGKEGDALAFACLDFVCAHWRHNGNSDMPPYRERRLADFIAFNAKSDNTTNCRGLSIMLADLLRAVGIRAKHVTCMPFEEPFNDCHVVVDCFLPSGARVMLDPTYCLYFTDAAGRYVSLPGLRKLLLEDGELLPNAEARYNGVNTNAFDLDGYREYMAKNTLKFSAGRINRDGDDESEEVALVPVGYPAEKTCVAEARILTDDGAFWGA